MTPDADATLLDGSSLQSFLSALWRRAWIIVVCLVVVPGAALAYSLQRPEQFEATSQVLLRSTGFEQAIASGGLAGTGTASTDPPDLATDAQVATLSPIAADTARIVGRGLTPGAVAAAVAVTTSGEANVLAFTATDTDPERAARVADVYGARYIAFRQEQARRRIAAARRALSREGDRLQRRLRGAEAARERAGRAPPNRGGQAPPSLRSVRALRARLAVLREREPELRTLSELQTGDATLVQRAEVPGAPSSPNVDRNVAGGVAVGLLLGILLAVFFEVLDRRLRHPAELEQLFDGPVLGAIPKSRMLEGGGEAAMRLPPPEKEAFRMLQSTIRYAAGDRPLRSVLVTSAAPGEGKSTVAWNVASAAAEGGASVLLVEADLHRGSLGRRLGLRGGSGLTDVVSGKLSLAGAIHEISVGDAERDTADADGPVPTMDVLLSGRRARNPRGLLASAAMGEVLRDAERDYDFVVVDAPPAGVVSDAIPLIVSVSGVLVVTRLLLGTREQAEHLRDQLRNLHAPVLGLVVNAVDTRDAYYGPGYAAASRYAGTRAS